MSRELDLVVLKRDYPSFGLVAGDVGVVVHVYALGKAFEVEFLDGEGRTIALLTLDPEAIRPLQRDEVFHVRKWQPMAA